MLLAVGLCLCLRKRRQKRQAALAADMELGKFPPADTAGGKSHGEHLLLGQELSDRFDDEVHTGCSFPTLIFQRR